MINIVEISVSRAQTVVLSTLALLGEMSDSRPGIGNIRNKTGYLTKARSALTDK